MWFAGQVRRVPESGRPGALRPGFHLERGMRVGLFGGSFDPAHDGHAHVAQTALRRLRLDRVIWLVSPHNPLKQARGPAPLAQRLAGARAVAHGPAMIVSDVESRIGSRYTLDTVRLLKGRFPGVRFVWLMGSDNLAGFHRWRGWSQIMREAPMAVVARPGALHPSRAAPAARRFAAGRLPARAAALLPGRPAPAWTYLAGPLNPTSSTALRARSQAASPVPG
ncbi:MAG TPA: nicotinate-nucleotide adenylyltransferase [Caulobacteraceae bacterium]|nr:nicotinate-nucleotide adenylyltransferase [Caulobacteraceae bacterium]